MKNVQSSAGFKGIQQIYAKNKPQQLPDIPKNLEPVGAPLKPF